MTSFHYEPMFQFEDDTTNYRFIGNQGVSLKTFEGQDVLVVDHEVLVDLTKQAFRDVNHLLRASHLASLSKILKDPEASDNDKFVARELLKNATIAAQGVLPSCQDTGTAIVLGKKGQNVWTHQSDETSIAQGIFERYLESNLRYSQVAPLKMFEEKNTKTNLPAQIEIMHNDGMDYKFLFMAKGGGSANKTYLYQQTKALLNPASLRKFVEEKLKTLGTAACPPYHLALVIGGTSAELTMKSVKLASAGYLDHLPTSGSEHGRAFRDLELEAMVMEIAQQSGIGAQFGGKYFAHDARVIRLPRHGASCPVGLGVSCSADRQIKAKINRDGVFIEQLEENPEQFLVGVDGNEEMKAVNLDRSMSEICGQLTQYPVGTGLSLSGEIVVGRDIAHAKVKERLDAGLPMPDYFKDNIIYYAGPAKTPPGYPSGSFGPTTAQRMDSYVPIFQELGGSLITLAKGNRSEEVTLACKKNGGFYLGSIGGPAARLGADCIKKIEVIDYPELGMEAIYKIRVENFPAFIIVDDKGNDFFAQLL